MSIDDQLAPADSLLGLLQRGRGLGYLRALDAPKAEVIAALSACLHDDPRLDAQQDERAAYFAGVLSSNDLALDLVRDAMRKVVASGGEDEHSPPPVHVLGALVRRGGTSAIALLVEELVSGPAWWAASAVLVGCTPRNVWEPLGDKLFARLAPSDIERLAEHGGGLLHVEPWKTWAPGVPRLRAVLADEAREESERPTRAYDTPKPSTQMSTEELLGCVTERNLARVSRILEHRQRAEDLSVLRNGLNADSTWVRVASLRGLTALGDTTCLDRAVEIVSDGRIYADSRFAHQYVLGLPPEMTRPHVRSWLSQAWPLPHLGRRVLEQHARSEDVPLLLSELGIAMTEGDHYRCLFAIKALTPLAVAEAHEPIRTYYETSAYSFGRRRAAAALRHLEVDFPQRRAFECLFDCEVATREVGVQSVDRHVPGAEDRLAFLASDPLEWDDLREAAAARLK